jgi:3D (Asp-Asp-Asp) domain-containing protein
MKSVLIFTCTILAILLMMIYADPQRRNERLQEETPQTYESISPKTETPPQRKYLGQYTIYAYCPCAKCCGKENGITASGTIATEGRTVAADLPFGTKIYIDGVGERIVEDRGGRIKGKTIDLFMSDHNSALQFGVRKLDVYEVVE